MGTAVVPDLPYAPRGVPGSSEAAKDRFAGVDVRRARMRRVPPWGGRSRPARCLLTTLLAILLASAGCAALLAPVATADRLTDQRAKVKHELAQTQGDLDESNSQLAAATSAVQQATTQLASARMALAETRGKLAAAEQRDRDMAAKLKQAQADLAAATLAVRIAQQALDAERATAGEMIRDQYQQQTNLLPLAMLVENSTVDLETRLQWSTTMFDTAQVEIERFTELQQQLDRKRASQAKIEQQVAADRRAAADALLLKQALEQRAADQATAVEQLLRRHQAKQRVAAQQVNATEARYVALQREQSSVDHRIAVRIAAARAAAARAAALRRAREAAAAGRAAGGGLSSAGSSSGGSGSGGSGGGRAAHGFIYPVSAPITSPYGMRFHPVLHVWKLHDGTDFGAGCGTAIHAAYAGRVAEEYYNVGYGNRLMIDHGFLGGTYVTTGYNHAIRYIVRVGQHVREGQVIGYVGTTGFSTGCHLHLMVWLNGRMVNPMSWF
jgi:murein DD-endopeptidase MepM/ murein hydrolase activator NlpD